MRFFMYAVCEDIMKKFLTILFIFLFCVIGSNPAFAKKSKVKMPTVKYKGSVYTLYFSEKSKELGGYLNEYYKQNEMYTNWTELIGVQHYPRVSSPIEHAKEFQTYFTSKNIKSNLGIDEDRNMAIIDFIMMNKNKLPIILEYNIFKFEKSPLKGVVAIQYAQRYLVGNPLEIDEVEKKIAKKKSKKIKALRRLEIPALINTPIDKGQYLTQNNVQSKKNTNTDLAPVGEVKKAKAVKEIKDTQEIKEVKKVKDNKTAKIKFKYDDPVEDFFSQNGEFKTHKMRHQIKQK